MDFPILVITGRIDVEIHYPRVKLVFYLIKLHFLLSILTVILYSTMGNTAVISPLIYICQ